MLDLHHLEVWRDDRCLFSGLSASLRPGDVLQVCGPNGAGKTTLLHLVAGLGRAQHGHVHWLEHPREHDPEDFQRNLLFIGHLPGIKAALTVAENLNFLAACRGLMLTEADLSAALARVGLDGYEDSPCGQLSAGQKRRVALARLFTEPVPLWILDEPFTAIDQQGVAELEGWIADHAERGGMALLTTHHVLKLRCPLRQLVLTRPVTEDDEAEEADWGHDEQEGGA